MDGLLKDARNYQGVDPAWLGRHHTLVLGKHSGQHAVQTIFAQLGVALTGEQIPLLLAAIRQFAEGSKRNPTETVITSYSIHYTKLYEIEKLPPVIERLRSLSPYWAQNKPQMSEFAPAYG